jgi:uncharacterized membrane protein YwzB
VVVVVAVVVVVVVVVVVSFYLQIVKMGKFVKSRAYQIKCTCKKVNV